MVLENDIGVINVDQNFTIWEDHDLNVPHAVKTKTMIQQKNQINRGEDCGSLHSQEKIHLLMLLTCLLLKAIQTMLWILMILFLRIMHESLRFCDGICLCDMYSLQ